MLYKTEYKKIVMVIVNKLHSQVYNIRLQHLMCVFFLVQPLDTKIFLVNVNRKVIFAVRHKEKVVRCALVH